jgi:hypothetical protein
VGRTVEIYQTHGITKSSTSLNPCFIGGIVGLLKNTSTHVNHKRAAHFNLCFIGGIVTVENTL